MTAAMYGVGAVICHQRPERSFFVSGVQMPVCARCAGLYAGAALAAVAVAMRGRRRAPDRDVLRLALCVAAVPTAATLVYEWSTGVMPANALRALLAVPLGGVIAWIVTRVSTATTAVEVH
ncbi:MAG: DUF2085 domain-containing protein [Acidobacteriaceae bacterium]|nr:DUF2085 domain-containing protein [Acidobacteriaceae bacterium]